MPIFKIGPRIWIFPYLYSFNLDFKEWRKLKNPSPSLFFLFFFCGEIQAFQAAWAAACKVEASTINVPEKYVFLVGPISFSGPYCQHDIVFQVTISFLHGAEKWEMNSWTDHQLFDEMPQLDGTIIAPTGSSHWGSGLLQWLEFTKLVGLTIKGSGKIDGNGAVWWQSVPYDDDPFDDQAKLIFPTNGTFGQKPPVPVINSIPFSLSVSSSSPTLCLVFIACFNCSLIVAGKKLTWWENAKH